MTRVFSRCSVREENSSKLYLGESRHQPTVGQLEKNSASCRGNRCAKVLNNTRLLVSEDVHDFNDFTIKSKRRERKRERPLICFPFRSLSLSRSMNLSERSSRSLWQGYIMDNVHAVGITCFTHHKPLPNPNLVFQ